MKKFAALLCALVHLGFSMVEARLGAATSSHLVVQHSQIEDAKRRVLLNFAIEYKPEGMCYPLRVSKCLTCNVSKPKLARVVIQGDA
jgi:hypothetical protein